MGGKKWNLLHRLIYITALAAVLHYFWKVKLDTTYPVYYALLVGVLLAARVWQRLGRRAAAASSRAVPVRREA